MVHQKNSEKDPARRLLPSCGVLFHFIVCIIWF
nr:MAG TPA: protein of unknown function (DUF4519) [Caudoviricetes sp.]